MKSRLADVDRTIDRAFQNPDRIRAGIEAVVASVPDRYHDAAAQLFREGSLRGSDGFFSTERSRGERQDAMKASSDFVQALDRAKGAYEDASKRYISTVQDQRLRDRVPVPNLSPQARETLARVDAAERLFLRNPEEALKVYKAVESGANSRQLFGELQRFEAAAGARFGEGTRRDMLSAAADRLPAGVSPEAAKLISSGSRAVATIVTRTAAADLEATRRNGISL